MRAIRRLSCWGKGRCIFVTRLLPSARLSGLVADLLEAPVAQTGVRFFGASEVDDIVAQIAHVEIPVGSRIDRDDGRAVFPFSGPDVESALAAFAAHYADKFTGGFSVLHGIETWCPLPRGGRSPSTKV
jgi:hypothetical protein